MTNGIACSHNLKSKLLERIYFITTRKGKELEQIYLNAKSGVFSAQRVGFFSIWSGRVGY